MAVRDLTMQQQLQKKHFFISYNKADISWAEWIAWELEAAGYSTIVQVWDFRPGFNFVIQMQRASKEAERVIAVLSPNYLSAEFTQPEWATAFARDPLGEKGLLLPVRVSECELEGLLPQIVYIDVVGLPEERAKDALLRGVKTERAKPVVKPPFPGAAQTLMFPGLLPPVWNVPHQRNPDFTGREDFLDELWATLTSGQPGEAVQAVHGPGGVGKSQVVLEYAYRHADKYRVVWWLRAEESSTLAADYASLYAKLELSPKDITDQSVMVNAVRERLTQKDDWLLIFDNARGADDVSAYIPQPCAGDVLITSRNPGWQAFARERLLQPLAADDAVNFLLKRTA
ncbi:MAG TPA: TIR domain-containing protein [Pyrinomonadaceae bacterium]